MTSAIRVSKDDWWTYIPVSDGSLTTIRQSIKSGLCKIASGNVVLTHENGNIQWDKISLERNTEAKLPFAIQSMSNGNLKLLCGENLCFGKKEGSWAYDDFTDLSISTENHESGLTISNNPIKDGQIVLTAWTSTGRLIPAQASVSNRRIWLELAESLREEGDRCFVLNENGSALLTIGKHIKEDIVRATNQAAVDSWLGTISAKSVTLKHNRFSVTDQNECFIIRDTKNGKSYKGIFRKPENRDFEALMIERALATKGLGAILPIYTLKNGEDSK